MRGLLVPLLVMYASSVWAANTNAPAGDWLGLLEVDGVKLRLLFKIRSDPSRVFIGSMDSIDQGAKDIAIDKITFQDKELRFEIKLIQAVFDGAYDASGDKFVGKWIQGSKGLPLTLARASASQLAANAMPPKDVAGSKRAGEKLSGEWSGILKSSGEEFRLGLNIRTNREGIAVGTLDSLDQGLTAIPLSSIVYKDGSVHFEAPGMGAAYDGVSFNNSTTVTGQWKQAGQVIPLKFIKTAGSSTATAPR